MMFSSVSPSPGPMGGAPSACESVSRASDGRLRDEQTQARHELDAARKTFSARIVVAASNALHNFLKAPSDWGKWDGGDCVRSVRPRQGRTFETWFRGFHPRLFMFLPLRGNYGVARMGIGAAFDLGAEVCDREGSVKR
jgi:hypothetical protein